MLFSFSVRAQPSFDASFIIDEIGPGSTTTLIYTIDNTDPVNPVSDLAFVNVLPAGLIIATPSQAISECINGLLVAPEGGGTITFTDGRISAATDCTIRLNVESSLPGTYNNTTGDLTSDAGNSGGATDDLTVSTDRPGFTKNFSPNTVNFGDRSTLTFTIDNSANSDAVNTITFIDNLPIGMVISDPSGLSTNCPDPITAITAIPDSQQISYNGNFATTTLNAGATCSVSVDVKAQARGRLNNTSDNLNVRNQTFQPLESGMAGDVLIVNSTGDIQLTQSFLDDPVSPGDQVNLQIELMNLNRNFNVTDISFINDLDTTLSGLVATGLPLNDVCGTGSSLSGISVLTLNSANLGPEESCTFTVTLDVPPAAVSGVYPNATSQPTGQITGQPTNGNIATDNLFINFAPQLTKSFTPDTITAGETTSMEFTITNTSAIDTVTDIAFSDNLSAFLSGALISALPANGFCGAGSLAFTTINAGGTFFQIAGANLAPGASCNFSLDLNTSNNTPPGTYTNTTGSISANIGGQNFMGKSASANLTINDAPELNMTFENDPVAPGDTVNVQYRIAGAEEGSLNATAISFTQDFDATLSGLVAVGLPLNDVCGTGSQLSGTGLVTLTGGSITNGSVCEFNVTLQVPAAAAPGNYPSSTSTLTSVVNGETLTTVAATDTLQINTLPFSHEFIDDPSLPGSTVILEYTIDNTNATNDATGMFFTHSLISVLPGLTYSGATLNDTCGTGSSLTGTTFILFTGGNLLAGESCTFSIPLDIPASAANNIYGSITSTLTGTINGNTVVAPASNDSLEINNNLLFFNKEFIDNPAIPGAMTSLEFTLVNNGTDTITGINFQDNLDAVLPGLAATGLPLNDVCGTGSVIAGTNLLGFTGGSLPAGNSCSFSIDVLVPSNALTGEYPNITTSVNGTMSGLAISGDPAIDDLVVGFIDFSKSFDGPVFSGDTAVLNFTIINNELNAANNLSFSDDLDAVLSGLIAVAPLPIDPCGSGSQVSGTSLISFSGGQIAANDSCSFDVTVQVPAGLGDSMHTNVTTDLTQAGVSVAPAATAELQVNGVPMIDITPANINFGSLEVGNTTAVQTVTVSNTGLGNLNIQSITAASGDFSQVASGTCAAAPFVLIPTASCTLDFTYSPTTAGLTSQDIEINSDSAGTNPTIVELSGEGLQAMLTLTPGPVDFGITELNTSSAPMVLTLTNNGTADLDVTAMTAAAGDFSMDSNNCGTLPFSLTPASSCTINYQFTPSIIGVQSQDITFTSDSSTSPDTVTLQGEGVTATLTLSSAQLMFPSTTINTTSTEQLMTVSNSGLVDLQITTLTAATGNFTLSGGSCSGIPITLTPGTSCTLGYTFSPTATGSFAQTISLDSNAASTPDDFELTGTGIEPGLQLSDAILDFQSINLNETSNPLTLTISNTGVADLIINSIDTPTAPFSVSGSTCGILPITLATNENCSLNYEFAPTNVNDFNQTISIQSNAATSPDGFELSGSGVEPGLQLNTATLDFEDIETNSTSAISTITLANTGTGSLNITDLTSALPPFSNSGGSCTALPINLNSGESCTLDYQFTPTTTGNFSQSIEITSNAPSSPSAFVLSGTGTEATLSTSGSTLTFGFTSEGDVQTQSLTITNSGSADAIISAISIPTATQALNINQNKAGGTEFSIDSSDCGTLPATIPVSNSCDLVISYVTQNVASNSSFEISSNDPSSPLLINLRGTGIVEPVSVPVMNLLGSAVLLLLLMLIAYRKKVINPIIR